jgi:DNA-binding transcriptional LysR family regulator
MTMLSEMRAFVRFVEEGSIQGTATRLNLTQSAVTRQIQRLEDMLGVALLDRRIKPPALTPTAHQVLEQCRIILRNVSDLRAACSPTRSPSGLFRIGVGYVLGGDELAECVDDIGRQFKDVSIALRTGWHPDLIEMVRQGQLDIGVIPTRPKMALPPGASGTIVGAEPLVFVIGRGSRFKSFKKHPSLSELAALPLIVKPRGTGTREVLEGMLRAEGLHPAIISEVRDEHLQLSLVARGLGMALVTQRSIDRYPRAKLLRSCNPRGVRLHLDVLMVRGGPLGHLAPVADALETALVQRFGPRMS